MTADQGWHNEPERHDLARQGVKTTPGITEKDAEKIVTAIKGKSPSRESQARSQVNDPIWVIEIYEEYRTGGLEDLPPRFLLELRECAMRFL